MSDFYGSASSEKARKVYGVIPINQVANAFELGSYNTAGLLGDS